MDQFKTYIFKKSEDFEVLNDSSIHLWFQRLAQIILSPTFYLVIKNVSDHSLTYYNLLEIEFYLYTDSRIHPDPFCHRQPIQKNSHGNWYFHSIGRDERNYKGGNYKGIDMTFELFFNGHVEVYGGILFRSMIKKDDAVVSKNVIEGPCCLVDKILETSGAPTIKDLVAYCQTSCDCPKRKDFYISSLCKDAYVYLDADGSNEMGEVFSCPRVGLPVTSLIDKSDHFKYFFKPYRFIRKDARGCIYKYKPLVLISQLHYHGKEEIKKSWPLTGSRYSAWKDCCLNGFMSKSKHLNVSKKRLSMGELIYLYGVWIKKYEISTNITLD